VAETLLVVTEARGRLVPAERCAREFASARR